MLQKWVMLLNGLPLFPNPISSDVQTALGDALFLDDLMLPLNVATET